ncbi:hypothetical protein ELH27_27465 (plasmid) [Rhizobium leguminosarum]|uniref:hypothetical protein n=1 Tax=Rhizobium leguminosarum TaxID=384 RepID=UPI0010325C81|nr:hypothetical protein [Rhizobium leguminosarum]TBC66360.1 hypothetical protein ELH27_27465 [Rhizobium leguminosarum]
MDYFSGARSNANWFSQGKNTADGGFRKQQPAALTAQRRSTVLKQPTFLRYQGNHLSCIDGETCISDCGNFDVWHNLLGYSDRDREENRCHESASVVSRKASQADTSAYGGFRLAYFPRQPSRIVGMAVAA